jgi:hypothetical protein
MLFTENEKYTWDQKILLIYHINKKNTKTKVLLPASDQLNADAPTIKRIKSRLDWPFQNCYE